MSRDQELCSFFCINGVKNKHRRYIVDAIVKLETCEADVAAEHAESLSCAAHVHTQQLGHLLQW